MAAIRRQVYGDLSRRFDDSMAQTLALMTEFSDSPDFTEGVASYAEERQANFPPLDPGFRVPGDHRYR
jgi:hypothetical protein